jgi:hypothetical protein
MDDPVTGPAAPPLPPELDALIRRMRLPYLRKAAPDVLATARAQRWEPAEALRVLLAEEVAGRDAATRRMRRKTAGFPSGKTFSSWRGEESSCTWASGWACTGRPSGQKLRGRRTAIVKSVSPGQRITND